MVFQYGDLIVKFDMRHLVILKGQIKLGRLSNSHYSGCVLELLKEIKHSSLLACWRLRLVTTMTVVYEICLKGLSCTDTEHS